MLPRVVLLLRPLLHQHHPQQHLHPLQHNLAQQISPVVYTSSHILLCQPLLKLLLPSSETRTQRTSHPPTPQSSTSIFQRATPTARPAPSSFSSPSVPISTLRLGSTTSAASRKKKARMEAWTSPYCKHTRRAPRRTLPSLRSQRIMARRRSSQVIITRLRHSSVHKPEQWGSV